MRTVPFAAYMIVTLAACGGRVEPLGVSEDAATEPSVRADGSTPTLGGGDAVLIAGGVSEDASALAGSSPTGSECPAVPPGNGGTCTPVDWQCEYGDAANPWCDRLARCYGDMGGWSNQALPVELCGEGACPASYAEIVQGDVCPVPNLGCAYSEGQCDCGQIGAGDGGPFVWSCFSPSGCPEPRPRIGSACTQNGLYCDYGACAGGAAEQCDLPYGWMQVLPTTCTYYE